jgi:hypothetical protein
VFDESHERPPVSLGQQRAAQADGIREILQGSKERPQLSAMTYCHDGERRARLVRIAPISHGRQHALGVGTSPASRRKVDSYRALGWRCRNVSLSRKALRGSQLPHVLTRVGVRLPGQVRTAAQRDTPVCRGAVNQQTTMP